MPTTIVAVGQPVTVASCVTLPATGHDYSGLVLLALVAGVIGYAVVLIARRPS